MTELNTRRCIPCEGGTAPLERSAAEKLLAQLDPSWVLCTESPILRRAFKFKDFYRAMSFANAVAHVANIEDHHPDIEVGWGYCRLQFTTHAIKGLSENDFICAAKVDLIPLS